MGNRGGPRGPRGSPEEAGGGGAPGGWARAPRGGRRRRAATHPNNTRANHGGRTLGRLRHRRRVALDSDAGAGDLERTCLPAPLLGNIPPIAETIPGFDYSGWQGFFVPKGTPKPVIDKLRAAVAKTVSLPEVKSALAAQATEVVTGTPEEFRKVAGVPREKSPGGEGGRPKVE